MLIEMLVVIGLLALITSIASITFIRSFTRSQFKKEAQTLVKTLTMAYNASTETDRRYAVILDINEQIYMLREYKTLEELTEFPEEDAILKIAEFTDNCWLDYIYFDDGTDSRDPDLEDPVLLFLCGRTGWQNGGKIALLDQAGNQYTIVVTIMLGVITLKEGDVEILIPRYKDDVPF